MVISFVRADHIGRPVFATNASGVKTWTAPRPSQACSGVRGENSPLDCFLVPLTPFGGVHTSTGAPPWQGSPASETWGGSLTVSLCQNP